ncbi:MAG: hypothetical protein HC895_01335 [Leptolyngbyaceae cyanobacterium SM1_3_5]|nr:hypothetical protein [Leptolyngbyaceae cyanobacterium SM1_3_5]
MSFLQEVFPKAIAKYATTEKPVRSQASWSLMTKFDDTNDALINLRAALAEDLSQFNQNERRTVSRRFYVTEEEAQQIDQLRQGISVSAFVRSKVLGSGIPRPRAIVPQINREAYSYLASLSGNCNQIAKAINIAAKQKGDLPLHQNYLNQLKQIQDLLIEIRLQLSQADDRTKETEDDWQGFSEQ